MDDGTKLLAYYDAALREVEGGDAKRFLDWVRKRRRPTEADVSFFLSEYTFIVSAAGFRESTVSRRFDGLRRALGEFDVARLKEMSTEQIQEAYMQYMLRNHAKAKAVAETLGRYTARTWEVHALLERLETTKDPDVLKILPYIGDALKYHFSRNLGLDVAKPDVHMLRLAPRFGFPADAAGVQAMCEYVAARRGERVGAVDYVLWYLAKVEATGDTEV